MSRRGPYRATTFLGVLRERAGLTQKQAARRLGITRQYLSLIEAGDYVPSLEVLQGLAQLYHQELREIVRLISLS